MAVSVRQAAAPPPDARSEAGPRPTLSIVDAMGIIVGTVVGAGIFRTPALVAGHSGGEGAMLGAWLLGGAISLVGALCYAELAATYPHAGGDFHYLGRAFGPHLAFLFAWARLTVIQTGSIALLAFVVGDYATQLRPLGDLSAAIYAAVVVVALTLLHAAGTRKGTRTQNLLTAAEILGLVLVVAAALAAEAPPPASGGAAGTTSFGLVLVFVLLTYGGWNEAAYVSAEVRDPGRSMVRALLGSLVLVTALYVLVNWAYLHGLGLAGMAQSEAVAADLLERAFGEPGARLVSVLVIVAALTSVNAAVFTGARTGWALGRAVPVLAPLGHWHPATGTPVNAVLAQGVLALLLVVLGAVTRKGFETMVEYTAPVFWLFFLLTGLALMVLRRRDAERRRPFRVPFYPLTPLLFIATCAYLLYASLAYTGIGALVGAGVLGVGVIVLGLVQLAARGRKLA